MSFDIDVSTLKYFGIGFVDENRSGRLDPGDRLWGSPGWGAAGPRYEEVKATREMMRDPKAMADVLRRLTETTMDRWMGGHREQLIIPGRDKIYFVNKTLGIQSINVTVIKGGVDVYWRFVQLEGLSERTLEDSLIGSCFHRQMPSKHPVIKQLENASQSLKDASARYSGAFSHVMDGNNDIQEKDITSLKEAEDDSHVAVARQRQVEAEKRRWCETLPVRTR